MKSLHTCALTLGVAVIVTFSMSDEVWSEGDTRTDHRVDRDVSERKIKIKCDISLPMKVKRTLSLRPRRLPDSTI